MYLFLILNKYHIVNFVIYFEFLSEYWISLWILKLSDHGTQYWSLNEGSTILIILMPVKLLPCT